MDYFILPDTLTMWPWPRQVNPHYREIGSLSRAWIDQFHVLSAKEKEIYDKCDFNLLTSLAFPTSDEQQLRSCCDMMHLFFVFDALSDGESGATVRQQADIIMDALRNPDALRPDAESPLGEITRQFWSRTLRFANPSPLTQRRFVDAFDAYTSGVVTQAEDRGRHLVRNIADYLTVRRDTIGTYPCFVLLELGMNLPENVLNDPVILDMERCITDIISISNDLYSYNVEQARGDDEHNMVTVVMKDLGINLHGALQWIEEHNATLEARFLNDVAILPKWGEEIDSQVVAYVNGLGNWPRANEAWSFETQRYFGKDGLEIKNHRKVTLHAKRL